MKKKQYVDPRIDLIIKAVEDEQKPVYISDVARKLDMEEQLVKNIVGGYIKQQMSVKNMMFHRIEPRFYVLAHGLQEFVNDKAIQWWLNKYYDIQQGVLK